MNAAVLIRYLCTVIVAGALLAFSPPSHAQQPSQNALAQAKEFVEIVGIARPFEGVFRDVIERVAFTYLQSNHALAKDLNEIAEGIVAEYFARRDELPKEVVRLFATRFTEQELKDMLTFYKSPLGKKLLNELQYVLTEVGKQAEPWSIKFRDEVAARFRAELKKKGHNL